MATIKGDLVIKSFETSMDVENYYKENKIWIKELVNVFVNPLSLRWIIVFTKLEFEEEEFDIYKI